MRVRRNVQFALVGVGALMLAACGGSSSGGSTPASSGSAAASSSSTETVKVGLLLPENQTVRWEKFDKPVFEESLKQACPNCELVYANAQNDAAKQQTQAESMLAQGVKVLVLCPVDGAAAATIVSAAKDKGVKVVGYGRTPGGPLDYTVSFDDAQLGKANGEALKAALDKAGKSGGTLVFINGDKTTPNTPGIRQGAIDGLGGSPNIGKEYYIKNWDPAEAQKAMDQAITALGKDKIAGVYVMNDGMAGGAIAAMKSAGISPIPPTTGMDADVAALQRILTGSQLDSLYNSPPNLAKAGAALAAQLAQGQTPATTGTLKNVTGVDVPLVKPADPIVITAENIKTELIDTGVYKLDEICTAEYKDACAKAGLS